MLFRLPRVYAAALTLFALFLSPLAEPAATTGTGARAEKSRFDIPAEDLGKALRDFAIQAKCNLSYDPASVEHLKAPAIKGDFTEPDALSLILRGTHLRAVNINKNTIQVLDRATSTSDSNSALTGAVVRLAYAAPDAPPPSSQNVAAPPEASSSAEDNKTPGLEEIVVTGTNISGVENKTVPLLTFDRDAIDHSGYATLSDFITALP
ncbi:MAG TPA: STN domain-containing protein, partial [Steroidobacteraceae bacterium]|nr:STN domain-containing protein [Steroidobacteraceae bacterium]